MRTLDPALVEPRMDRLRADLESGAWDEKWGHLRDLPELDLGYRLLVSALARRGARRRRGRCIRYTMRVFSGWSGSIVTSIGSSSSGSGGPTSRISAAISTFL